MEVSYVLYRAGESVPNAALFGAAVLYRRVWQAPPWNECFSLRESLEEIKKPLEREDGILILAKEDNKVVGGTTGWPMTKNELSSHAGLPVITNLKSEKLFYVAEVFVDSSVFRQGIGRTMTKMLIKQSEINGIGTFALRTDIEALPARRLYASLGFVEMSGWYDLNQQRRTYWIRS